MYIVGFVIFAAYIYFTIWNIFYSAKKSKQENYPDTNVSDTMDMDGMGNFSRFPTDSDIKIRRVRATKKKEEVQ